MSTDPSCPSSSEPTETKIDETEQEEKNVETETTTVVAEEPPVPLRKEDVEPTGSQTNPSSARTSILTSRTSDTVGEEVSISIDISEAKDEPTKDEPDGVSRSATAITEHSLESSEEERTVVEPVPPVQEPQVEREEEEAAPVTVITDQPMPTAPRNPARRESAVEDGCTNCCIRSSR